SSLKRPAADRKVYRTFSRRTLTMKRSFGAISVQPLPTDAGFPEKSVLAISRTDRAIFLARLLQKHGVPLDMDWRNALSLTVRTYNVLAASGYVSLGDVLEALQNNGRRLMHKKNFGRRSLDDLWYAIEQLAGPEAATYQSNLFESPG